MATAASRRANATSSSSAPASSGSPSHASWRFATTASAVTVLEREDRIGAHQTTRSSGVIHAGIYYQPGSLKARLCVEGARDLYAYCEERGIPAERIGKVIVATSEDELPRLDELERRGRANEVPGLERIGPEELRAIEPHAAGIDALHSPATQARSTSGGSRPLRG